jgi:hypothetical protein
VRCMEIGNTIYGMKIGEQINTNKRDKEIKV